jgi:putative component of toxin-antitoxin plasmid stabilization module
MYKIDHYLLENGADPFEKWLKELRDIKARAKINVKVDRLSMGNFSSSRPLGEGVSELKIDYGPGYIRPIRQVCHFASLWWRKRYAVRRYRNSKGVLD